MSLDRLFRYQHELLAREAALRAAGRDANPVDQANADRLRALRLWAELEPSRGVLPLFDPPRELDSLAR